MKFCCSNIFCQDTNKCCIIIFGKGWKFARSYFALVALYLKSGGSDSFLPLFLNRSRRSLVESYKSNSLPLLFTKEQKNEEQKSDSHENPRANSQPQAKTQCWKGIQCRIYLEYFILNGTETWFPGRRFTCVKSLDTTVLHLFFNLFLFFLSATAQPCMVEVLL